MLELCEYCIASSLLAKMQQKFKMQVLYNRLHENLGRFIGWIIVYLSIPTVLLELMKLVCSFHVVFMPRLSLLSMMKGEGLAL
jgi:hypothetical protein